MHTVTLEEATATLPKLVAEVSQGGEVIITVHDKPVARLEPVSADSSTPNNDHAALFGLWKGKIILTEGWDDPLEEMEPYTE